MKQLWPFYIVLVAFLAYCGFSVFLQYYLMTRAFVCISTNGRGSEKALKRISMAIVKTCIISTILCNLYVDMYIERLDFDVIKLLRNYYFIEGLVLLYNAENA